MMYVSNSRTRHRNRMKLDPEELSSDWITVHRSTHIEIYCTIGPVAHRVLLFHSLTCMDAYAQVYVN